MIYGNMNKEAGFSQATGLVKKKKISDPFLAFSEDFNFKFSRENMPRTPLVGSH